MVRIDIQNSHPSLWLAETIYTSPEILHAHFWKKCSSTKLIFRIVVTLPFDWLKYLWILQTNRMTSHQTCTKWSFTDQFYIHDCPGFLYVETLSTSSLEQLHAKSPDLPETFSCEVVKKMLLLLRAILNQSYLNCFE